MTAMAPRSILFVSLMNGAAWGGSEELWSRAAAFAAREGARVTCAVYAWEAKAKRLAALREAGCAVVELPNAGRARATLLERLEYALVTGPRRRAAFARLPLEAHDLVVLNQGGWEEAASGELAPLVRRLRRYALTFHSYREDLALRPARAARLRALASGAAANLFAARRIQAVLEDRLGAPIPNAHVLVNPIGFAPGPVARWPASPPLRLATVGALEFATKAQDLLVEALAAPAWRERPVTLEMWGAGRDEVRLRALVEHHGLGGKVRLGGFTTDPRAVLAGAHLVLQLSRQEAIGITLMEAMALGRPVAVTRVGDMPAWIEDGVSGFISERATLEDVAATLERAWARREGWAGMGEAAHRAFQARYPASVERHFLEQLGA